VREQIVIGMAWARATHYPHVVHAGTPGTMLDYVRKYRAFDPARIVLFCLDEADVMIGMQGHHDQSIKMLT
jgi:superfamily II DNA/RNA helicase